MKRNYERMTVTTFIFEVESRILAGSVTNQVIKAKPVMVRNFDDDSGFDDGGFEANFD